tara:strand:- start:137 stop:511 length:375 start_codon:yes stop_codon:yes gene_type:complete
MDAKELRLGNLIRLGDVEAIVSILEMHNGTNSINELNQDMIEPVRLTTDILQRFSFKKKEGNNITWYLDDFEIGWYGNSYATWKLNYTVDGKITEVYSQIEFVHQFQNIYDDITRTKSQQKDKV